MAFYKRFAQTYFDNGFIPVPIPAKINGIPVKGPIIKDWVNIFSNLTDEQLEYYIDQHGNDDLGILPINGLVAIDFDYDGENNQYENQIIGVLPPRLVTKVGNKGWTSFYYDPTKQISSFSLKQTEDRVNKSTGEVKIVSFTAIECFSNGSKQTKVHGGHPDNDKGYKYVTQDTLLNTKLQDLPIIDAAHIQAIKAITETCFKNMQPPSETRYDYVVGKIMYYLAKGLDDSDIARRVVALDQAQHKDHEKGPYFTDKKYFRSKNKSAEMNCLQKISSIKKWQALNPQSTKNHQHGDTDDVNIEELYFKLFDKLYKNIIKRDRFSGVLYFIDGPLDGKPVANYSYRFRIDAINNNMPKPHMSVDFFYKWSESIKGEVLLPNVKHDGRFRIKEILDHLSFNNIKKEYGIELMLEWISNMYRKIDDPMLQNFALILKGAQGEGKDFLVNTLFSCLGRYKKNVVTFKNEENAIAIFSKSIVVNISEFDNTKKVGIPFLKTLLTEPTFTLRKPYKEESKDINVCASVISTANIDNILRDHTGNRRFIILDINIDKSYSHKIDLTPEQILAEIRIYAQQKIRASAEARVAVDIYNKENAPEDIAKEIILDFHQKIIDTHPMSTDGTEYLFKSCREYAKDLAKDYGVSFQSVTRILRQNGILITSKNNSKKIRLDKKWIANYIETPKGDATVLTINVKDVPNLARLVKGKELKTDENSI